MATALCTVRSNESGLWSAIRQFFFVKAETAIADAVKGHQEAARSHGLECGEIKSLPFVGQANDGPALAKQREERAPVKKFRRLHVLDAGGGQAFGQFLRQPGTLVAHDHN